MRKALDLFCGVGGASMGLHRAGYEVTGVDLHPQKHYPFEFIQGDALTFPLEGYDLIWASPPCQAFSQATVCQGPAGVAKHLNLIPAIRARLKAGGIPYIIENVPGAPLYNATTLCGLQFGLKVYRHRKFESNMPLFAPSCHPRHNHTMRGQTGDPKDGEIAVVAGHFADVEYARFAMGIDWANQRELAQAIPPAYAEWLARQII